MPPNQWTSKSGASIKVGHKENYNFIVEVIVGFLSFLLVYRHDEACISLIVTGLGDSLAVFGLDNKAGNRTENEFFSGCGSFILWWHTFGAIEELEALNGRSELEVDWH